MEFGLIRYINDSISIKKLDIIKGIGSIEKQCPSKIWPDICNYILCID